MILFLYKIIIGKYPNPGLDLASMDPSSRNGLTIKPKLDLSADEWVKTVRISSFSIKHRNYSKSFQNNYDNPNF